MPSFAEKARQAQQEKRAGRDEKDPADLSGAQEPDWDNAESWGGGGSGTDNSTSGNAGDAACGKQGQEHEPAAPPTPTARMADRRPPRRRGRPRGPQRAMLSVRVLAKNDRRLTVAVDRLEMNPQSIVDEALDAFFRRHKIEDPGPEKKDGVA